MDGLELVREKPRVIVSLADPERVGGKILLRDEPRLARGVVAAAHTDALALAERIEGKAHVLAHDRAVGNADRTGLGRQIAVEELAERTLADEADARGVLLLRIGKLEVVGDAADLGLADFAHGEDHAGDLLLGEAVQEVALVLAGIDAAQQLDAVVRVTDAGVVPRGDEVGPHGHGMVEEGAELDLCVAENVGIGRAASAVFAQKVGEDALAVFLREVDGLDVDADHVGDGARVDEVLTGGAVFAVIVVLPVLHEEADDVVALLLEEPGADRGVDAARKADDDGFLGHTYIWSVSRDRIGTYP